jgi:hypothetical protein
MDHKFLNKISVVVKEKPVWDAYLEILEYYEKDILKLLGTPQSENNLVRINAKIELLRVLKNIRDIANGLYGQPKSE